MRLVRFGFLLLPVMVLVFVMLVAPIASATLAVSAVVDFVCGVCVCVRVRKRERERD